MLCSQGCEKAGLNCGMQPLKKPLACGVFWIYAALAFGVFLQKNLRM
jgi:hypothetical protein